MAIENTVSSNFYPHSLIVKSIFDCRISGVMTIIINPDPANRERSGSVVECLARDRGAVGSSLTGVTVLCP